MSSLTESLNCSKVSGVSSSNSSRPAKKSSMALPGEMVGGGVFGGIVGGGVVIVGMVNVGSGIVGGGEMVVGLVGGGIVGGGVVLGTVNVGNVGNVGKVGKSEMSEVTGLDVPGDEAGMVAGTVVAGTDVGGVCAFAPDIISHALPPVTATSIATRRFQTCTPTSRSAPSKDSPGS
jgi:hypothetical protein